MRVTALTGLLLAAARPLAAFSVGIEMPVQLPVAPPIVAGLKDLGIDYLNYYVTTFPQAAESPAAEANQAMVDLCRSLPVDYSIACHTADPPLECVREAAAAGASEGRGRFLGVVFDELEHARLINNYASEPLADFARFESLPQAYEETLAGLERLSAKFAGADAPVVATHIFPVLLHPAARAGFHVCPKICKELYSPVSLAIGMGAAKQYGRELWADCDLWFWDLLPGHSPEELRSNLLLAYWLGADRVYVEGAGFNLKPVGKQGIPFSLLTLIDQETYQLTPHGEVLRAFCRDYVPTHPREWTFRDVLPDIAIIRFEDTCHGQRYTVEHFPDRLYGSDKLKSDADTEAWLGIWNLLTFGRTGRDGLTFFKAWVGPSGYQRAVEPGFWPSYLTRPAQSGLHHFFAPLRGTVVYDHTVGREQLEGVPLLFLTGVGVTGETMEAIRGCVEAGAVCVAWGPLARRHGFPEWAGGVQVVPSGAGRFVLTDDFGKMQVYDQIKTLIGRPDEIRYRFRQGEVSLRPTSADGIEAEVTLRPAE